jgi:replicative DNA helicase
MPKKKPAAAAKLAAQPPMMPSAAAASAADLRQEIYRTRIATANALAALRLVPHTDEQWNDALYAYTIADLAWRRSLNETFNQSDEIIRQTTLRLATATRNLEQALTAVQNSARIAQFAMQAATLAAAIVGLF